MLNLRRCRMKKRGEVSSIFQYIFIMIVGGLILFFFIKFGMNMVDTSEKVTAAKTSNIIDDSLTAFGVNMNSNTFMPEGGWPKEIKVTINCGDISSENFIYPVKSQKVIFSPKELEGKRITVWTKEWKWPFGVENFYYLSNDNTRYYLVGDYGDILDKNSGDYIPSRFNVTGLKGVDEEYAKRQAEKYDMVKFVFFNQDISLEETNKIKVMRISTDDFETGTVEFSNGETGIFLGREMLYGAIFSNDHANYKCMYERASTRLKMISQLYIDKTNTMKLRNPDCNYGSILSNLNELVNLIDTESSDTGSYVKIKENLDVNNKEFYGDLSCKVVF